MNGSFQGLNLIAWNSALGRKQKTPEDPKRVLPKVSFPALQFNTAKKQFEATRKVPKAVIPKAEMRALIGLVSNTNKGTFTRSNDATRQLTTIAEL